MRTLTGRQPQIHPSAKCNAFAIVDAGARADAGAVIESGAMLLRGAHLQAGATAQRHAIVGRGAVVKKGAIVPENSVIGDGATFPGDPLYCLTAARYSEIWNATDRILNEMIARGGPCVNKAKRLAAEALDMSPGRLSGWVSDVSELCEAEIAELRKQFSPEEWAREVALAQARFEAEEAEREAP